MALKPGDQVNFNTMLRAASRGHLALMECRDKKTGKYVAVIVMHHLDGDESVFTPVAKLFEDNPYEEVDPPQPNIAMQGAG